MIWTINNNIHIHKGNSGEITIPLTFENAPYTMNANDVLVITVRKYSGISADNPPVLTMEKTGTNVFPFVPADTNGLAFGTYHYDAKLFLSNGEETTVIGDSDFCVEKIITKDKAVS